MSQNSPYVFDIHCDLLSYLSYKKGRTPFDHESRCNLRAMVAGKVAVQVLAIYVSGEGRSQESCRAQIQDYISLTKNFPSLLQNGNQDSIKAQIPKKIQILPAFENIAGILPDHIEISLVLAELNQIYKSLKHIAYISLTWDGENRYGGGAGCQIGLKDDGKKMIEWMDEKHIPLDISHASDHLCYDILNFIEKRGLSLPVIASHSNFRFVTNKARNLPDEFAKEIIKRNGLIGINFFCHFSGGKNVWDIFSHIEHGLRLGAEKALCLGADFFDDETQSYIEKKYGSSKCFYDELSNAACYPRFLEMLYEQSFASETLAEDLFHKNTTTFYSNVLSKQH